MVGTSRQICKVISRMNRLLNSIGAQIAPLNSPDAEIYLTSTTSALAVPDLSRTKDKKEGVRILYVIYH